jgi:hypothetical protein
MAPVLANSRLVIAGLADIDKLFNDFDRLVDLVYIRQAALDRLRGIEFDTEVAVRRRPSRVFLQGPFCALLCVDETF